MSVSKGILYIKGENRVVRMFRPQRNEVVGGWTKLCNGELNILCLHQV